MTNNELESILPDVRTMLHSLDTKDFSNYEQKLSAATSHAIDALESIITDGTLALDPEQTVKAVEVLTKSKMGLVETRRKLIETCIKGEVMIKALDQSPKKGGESSALLEYLEKNKLNGALDKTGTAPGSSASIFESIAQDEKSEE